jgi:hypothetical protein
MISPPAAVDQIKREINGGTIHIKANRKKKLRCCIHDSHVLLISAQPPR